jgi:hypothetical protein
VDTAQIIPNAMPWLMAELDNTLPGAKNAEKNALDNWKRWQVPIVAWFLVPGTMRAMPMIIGLGHEKVLVPVSECPEFARIVNTLEAEEQNQPEFTLINIRNILREIRDKM